MQIIPEICENKSCINDFFSYLVLQKNIGLCCVQGRPLGKGGAPFWACICLHYAFLLFICDSSFICIFGFAEAHIVLCGVVSHGRGRDSFLSSRHITETNHDDLMMTMSMMRMIRWFDVYNNDGDDHEFTMTRLMQTYNRNKPWWLDDDHNSAEMMIIMVSDDNFYCFDFLWFSRSLHIKPFSFVFFVDLWL